MATSIMMAKDKVDGTFEYVLCDASGNLTVSVDSINISGQTVDINGQTVKSQIYDYNNYAITSQQIQSKRGLDVNNIGTLKVYEGTQIRELQALTDIHNNINLLTYDDALNDKINSCDTVGQDTGAIKTFISNNNNSRVPCDIQNQTVNVNTISGYNLEETQLEIKSKTDLLTFNNNGTITELNVFDVQSYTKLDAIDTAITNFTLDKSTSSIDISGQTILIKNTDNTDIKLTSVNNNLQTDAKLYTSAGDAITSTNITAGKKGIDTTSVLYTTNGTTVSPVNATAGALNVNLTNAIDISGVSTLNNRLLCNITNESINVNNQITNYALENGNLLGVKNNTDKFIFSNNRLLCDVSGSVNVNNQLTNYALENGNLASIKTNTDKFIFSNDRLLSDVSGSVNINNQLTNYSLENGNLLSVKNNTDKFKFTGDDLKTTITNPLLTVETGTNALDVNIVAGTITGANGKAYLYSGDEATSITATTISTKNGIDTNIINSSIDTHMYASTNGTNWHHLSSDSNGQLNIHSKTQDGAGTDISSTLNSGKQSLDVNLTNNNSINVDISGVGLNGDKLKCDVSGQHIALDAQLFSLSTGYSPHVLTCSYTDFYDQQYSLDTASTICTTGFDINGGLRRRELTGKDIVYKTSTSPDNRYALDTTSHIATKGTNLTTDPTYMTSSTVNSKNGLDVNVINNTVKVDISGATILEGKIAVFDALSFPYIERISVGAGADINAFTFGNFYSNITINAGAFSTPGNFAAGSYGRKAMLFYRDGATSSTDSISFYTNSNFGVSTPLFVATTYPIVNGVYRWSTIILNILPFSSLYIRNDSTTINNTGVNLTMIGV